MYPRILIVIDARQGCEAAVREGVGIAAALGSEVVLCHPLPRYTVPLSDLGPAVLASPEAFDEAARLKAGLLLDEAQKIAQARGVASTRVCRPGGDDAHAVVEAASHYRCGLIVAASEDHNAVVRLLSGSIIPGLITAATVPVLVVKPDAAATAPGV